MSEQYRGEEITMCGLLDKYNTQGIVKGIVKGESPLAGLMECLFKDNRMAEATLVLTDVETGKRLYCGYGLV